MCSGVGETVTVFLQVAFTTVCNLYLKGEGLALWKRNHPSFPMAKKKKTIKARITSVFIGARCLWTVVVKKVHWKGESQYKFISASSGSLTYFADSMLNLYIPNTCICLIRHNNTRTLITSKMELRLLVWLFCLWSAFIMSETGPLFWQQSVYLWWDDGQTMQDIEDILHCKESRTVFSPIQNWPLSHLSQWETGMAIAVAMKLSCLEELEGSMI